MYVEVVCSYALCTMYHELCCIVVLSMYLCTRYVMCYALCYVPATVLPIRYRISGDERTDRE